MPVSAILITLALTFYTTATWWEKINGRLKKAHLLFFWLGLIFDTSGTGLMIKNSTIIGLNLHSLTGYIGILLMLIHTIWATVVLNRRNETAIMNFHKLSLVVWSLWIFSYLNGVVLGLSH
ncbi:MAG: TIGR03987 family protein [Candidatus Marinimicrobia bacterium]|nr:TIGR03987 family protein [Candidatus Neomarinimicrobiota bacterium]MBT3574938.1 TIGR03987 family protein [Candidatus Neomarinimicrobiota bacterium]MBT3681338.1 TIGR03987 family protein [Candidatus Neomarinimicrobiota bacterium]MBT3949871.1 TIGR03987 family protein [Candidatus Neomarinimicrobiota bacterium]MBT4253100.1 TIGR03987 family protein [Candidatus Neomarinimicrobiota bacterium]